MKEWDKGHKWDGESDARAVGTSTVQAIPVH
jgi:hypothetical protein